MKNNIESNFFNIPSLIGQETADKIYELHKNSEFKRQIINVPGPIF
jgi:hypothetical protein